MAIGDNFMWFVDSKLEAELPTGETTDWFFSQKKAFEPLEFEFGMTGPREETGLAQASTGSAGEANNAQFNELRVKKYVDLASVKFYQACSKNTEFDTAMIAVRKASGAGYLLYMQYILRLVRVLSVTWTGASGDKLPEETVRLSFKAMGFRYVQQDATGDVGDRLEWRWTTVSTARDGLSVGSKLSSDVPFERDQVVPTKAWAPKSGGKTQ